MFVKSAVVLILSVGLVGCDRYAMMPDDDGCTEPVGRAKVPFQVRLEILEDSLGGHYLVVVEPPQCTLNPTEKGCITVPQDKIGEITFKLKDGTGPNCPGGGQDKWHLKGVQMSMQAKNTSGTVTDAVKCDFGTNDQGHVLSPVFPGGPQMKIRDWNSEKYNVYYTVTAASCDHPNTTITTDPWIENKG